MKRFLGIILLALITSFIWRDVVVYGVFKIQQDYIAQYQCVNRNKPITQCNGSCVLTERLAQPLQDLPSNDSEPVLVQIKMNFILDVVEEISAPDCSESRPDGFLQNTELQGFLPSIIKPPETV